MIKNRIHLGESGASLWLPELRESFARSADVERIVVRLSGRHYGVRERELFLPTAQDGAERDFLLRYLSANIYNLLSAYSASELCVFCGGGTAELVRALPPLFEGGGLGKVSSVARRIYGGLAFRISPLDEYAPTENAASAVSLDLPRRLRDRVRASAEKSCVGIDVGGSDIKLAVSCRGSLLYTKEYDWNPAASPTADGITEPILALVREAAGRIAREGGTLDAVGISFPDVVIGDRIVGGETPKTKGMRENAALDYETEFAKLRELRAAILPLCAPGAAVRLTNDGNMSAYTAAVELAEGGADEAIRGGVVAHSLGTDLGTGWLLSDGTIPAIPLELYDLLLDLGDLPAAALPPADLRSTRNENSGMPGVRRYLGQAAAYRLAWTLDPSLLDGFVRREGELLTIPTAPEDLRKPCLEHLMRLAAEGDGSAEEIFRRIGKNLSVVAQEMNWLFGQTPPSRFLFGRFVKSRRCFELLCEGFGAAGTGIRLIAADDDLANTPLMRQLAQMPGVTVAQFAQAIGAIYYAAE